ncbi:penicillin-binding protein 2 MrdA [Candidatus Tachikawaea gelatinosa]|uniref:Penicillin-binding protein 2 n=2 Tax=Candidatus Tachikawaea gelatinosa TaxID=1410383 RepID=A0A090BWF1_9ENTR|nr:penicillin-binding protein 2 MrdA [Candidatus Tachikawaea gelatinosa]
MFYKKFVQNDIEETNTFIRRVFFALFIVFFLSCLQIVNFYYLQILQFKHYSNQSNKNRLRIKSIPSLRGNIYSRDGFLLAKNCVYYQAKFIPYKNKKLYLKSKFTDEKFNKIKKIFNFNSTEIKILKKKYYKNSYFHSFIIKNYINFVQMAKLIVNLYDFPEIVITSHQYRYYPYGSLTSHTIGYVSGNNRPDTIPITSEKNIEKYVSPHYFGKTGIEKQYNHNLKGKLGYKKIEINSLGQETKILYKKMPDIGEDLHLSIDIKFQRYIESLINNYCAAVIISDPKNGEVLSLVSTPSYDPNNFIHNIAKHSYFLLLNNLHKPLYNRVTQALYPPASTIKPYIAFAALSSKIINKDTILRDSGYWILPTSMKLFHDWKKYGHGDLNITQSIEESSDIFFYEISYKMGIDNLSKWIKKFGYGKKTGIDLPTESLGIVPTREWKKNKFKEKWYQGDTIPVGIGQGYLSSTLVQMNKSLVTLVNNGVSKTPHIVNSISKKNRLYKIQEEHKKDFILDDKNYEYWKIIKNAMYGVAHRKSGTAYKNFVNVQYKIGAKSGTAQLFNLKKNQSYTDIPKNLRDHKIMIAFMPYNKPRFVISIIIENGGREVNIGKIMKKITDYIALQKIYK